MRLEGGCTTGTPCHVGAENQDRRAAVRARRRAPASHGAGEGEAWLVPPPLCEQEDLGDCQEVEPPNPLVPTSPTPSSLWLAHTALTCLGFSCFSARSPSLGGVYPKDVNRRICSRKTHVC